MERNFIDRRMDHLRDELMRKGLWNEEDNNVYEQVRTVMVNELDNHESKSSLLHGDLWARTICFLQMEVQLYLIRHHFMVIESLT